MSHNTGIRWLVIGLLALPLRAVEGQSLDIGGIDLALGQDVADAMKSLSAYHVNYDDSGKFWLVTQMIEGSAEPLGMFSAVSGKIVYVWKGYRLRAGEDGEVYTQAFKDVRKKGGSTCVTRPVEYTDDRIHAFEYRCGEFRLTYSLPGKFNGSLVAGGISIAIGGDVTPES